MENLLAHNNSGIANLKCQFRKYNISFDFLMQEEYWLGSMDKKVP